MRSWSSSCATRCARPDHRYWGRRSCRARILPLGNGYMQPRAETVTVPLPAGVEVVAIDVVPVHNVHETRVDHVQAVATRDPQDIYRSSGTVTELVGGDLGQAQRKRGGRDGPFAGPSPRRLSTIARRVPGQGSRAGVSGSCIRVVSPGYRAPYTDDRQKIAGAKGEPT